MALTSILRDQYVILINDKLDAISVALRADFSAITNNLRKILANDENLATDENSEINFDPQLKEVMQEILEYLNRPEDYVEFQEDYAEYQKIIKDRIQARIEKFNAFTEAEKYHYIQDQKALRALARENQHKMRAVEPKREERRQQMATYQQILEGIEREVNEEESGERPSRPMLFSPSIEMIQRIITNPRPIPTPRPLPNLRPVFFPRRPPSPRSFPDPSPVFIQHPPSRPRSLPNPQQVETRFFQTPRLATLAYLNERILRDPNDISARLSRAAFCERSESISIRHAIRDYRYVLMLDPQNTRAQAAMGRLASQVTNIDATESDNIDHRIDRLINANLLLRQQAGRLTRENQVRITNNPVYTYLMRRYISVNNVLGLTEQQHLILTFEPMEHLLLEKRITINHALHLSHAERTIITTGNIYNYILKSRLSVDQALRMDQNDHHLLNQDTSYYESIMDGCPVHDVLEILRRRQGSEWQPRPLWGL